MPIILMFIGIVFVLSGVKGTEGDVLTQFKTNLIGTGVSGSPAFWKWAVAMFAIGATGYYKPIRPITISFLVLIFIVLILDTNQKNPALAKAISDIENEITPK